MVILSTTIGVKNKTLISTNTQAEQIAANSVKHVFAFFSSLYLRSDAFQLNDALNSIGVKFVLLLNNLLND